MADPAIDKLRAALDWVDRLTGYSRSDDLQEALSAAYEAMEELSTLREEALERKAVYDRLNRWLAYEENGEAALQYDRVVLRWTEETDFYERSRKTMSGEGAIFADQLKDALDKVGAP